MDLRMLLATRGAVILKGRDWILTNAKGLDILEESFDGNK